MFGSVCRTTRDRECLLHAMLLSYAPYTHTHIPNQFQSIRIYRTCYAMCGCAVWDYAVCGCVRVCEFSWFLVCVSVASSLLIPFVVVLLLHLPCVHLLERTLLGQWKRHGRIICVAWNNQMRHSRWPIRGGNGGRLAGERAAHKTGHIDQWSDAMETSKIQSDTRKSTAQTQDDDTERNRVEEWIDWMELWSWFDEMMNEASRERSEWILLWCKRKQEQSEPEPITGAESKERPLQLQCCHYRRHSA